MSASINADRARVDGMVSISEPLKVSSSKKEPKMLSQVPSAAGNGCSILTRHGHKGRRYLIVLPFVFAGLMMLLFRQSDQTWRGDLRLEKGVQARWRSFDFQFGEMIGLDRAAREIRLAATYDDEGRELTPQRTLHYDTLVIAVGSITSSRIFHDVREPRAGSPDLQF